MLNLAIFYTSLRRHAGQCHVLSGITSSFASVSSLCEVALGQYFRCFIYFYIDAVWKFHALINPLSGEPQSKRAIVKKISFRFDEWVSFIPQYSSNCSLQVLFSD